MKKILCGVFTILTFPCLPAYRTEPLPITHKPLQPKEVDFALSYAEQAHTLKKNFYQIPGTLGSIQQVIPSVSFEKSMAVDSGNWFAHGNKSDRARFIVELYKKNNLGVIQPASHYRIPPIIHQIWVGPKSPKKFEQLRQTWLKFHPGWLYKLWTDEDLKKLKLVNHHYYEKALNYAARSDILRYEVLYLFGGVYVDIDFECVKPLDILHRRYDFYVGVAPGPFVMLNSGLMAAAPYHPIIKQAIETVSQDDVLGYPDSVGPNHLTKAFFAVAPQLKSPLIALPVSYFYPLLQRAFGLKRRAIEAAIKPESFAVHYWASSWDDIRTDYY